ncbi:MAG: hypothetical protein JOY83_03720 [Alphaproteobacteria bacterium]|nr:hypothetical protein [Alphaproteobacteria bacterium]
MKTLPLALALVFAVVVGASAVHAADTVCSGTISASTVSGNLVVPQNASCILQTVSVTGNVEVLQNASLSVQAYVEPSSIGGNILADHCALRYSRVR